MINFCRKLFLSVIKFIKKILLLHRSLSLNEKRIVFSILFLIIILGYLRVDLFIQRNTILTPTSGGIYKEVLVGKFNHVNPILARNFIDNNISALIYPGLTTLDEKGNLKPLLAKTWQIPEEGKKYVFELRKNIKWHDGVPFTSQDVAYTIQNIQDPLNQSPYEENWRGVKVNTSSKFKVEFELKEKSAPFLSATTIGILPAHIPFKDQDRQMIGTGPYLLKNIAQSQDKVSSVTLESNPLWFERRPWITSLHFDFVETLEEAESDITKESYLSLVGKFYSPPQIQPNFNLIKIPTNRKILLFLNAGSKTLSDLKNRKKLLAEKSIDKNPKLTLLTDTKSANNQKLSDFITKRQKVGIKLQKTVLESGVLQEKIEKREYDILAVPIDFGKDLDLYPFFHSSQDNPQGLNFSNIKDKDLDKLLEEARINLDTKKRQALQKQIDQKINNLALYYQIDQENFYWLIGNKIKGIPKIESIINPENRLNSIEGWYVNEKKVLKPGI